MQTALIILVSVFAAYFAVKWVYFKILWIAKKFSIVDNPDARKLQKRPVPVLGGIAVFFGLAMGVLAGAATHWIATGSMMYSLIPILCAMIIMIYTGAMDDIHGLTPRTRFIIEILAVLALIYSSGGCIDSFHGLWGIGSFSWWFAVPLTVFAGVGIINAINMIDGVNGLCSGLCLLFCLLFGYMFLKVQELPNSVLAFSMAASVIPFFFHNVFGRRSKMFLGDAGTMMIGILMVWFTISALRSDSPVTYIAYHKKVNMIAMALAILSVPVFDTVRVMVQRIWHGNSPFHPDKTHLHHVFIRAGVSHSVTTLLEVSINLFIVLVWALVVKLHVGIDMQLYIVVLLAFILVWGLYFFISWHERNHTSFMHRLAKFGIKTHLGHTEHWLKLENWLDSQGGKEEEEVEEKEEEEIQSRMVVYDLLKGKSEVYVRFIKERSGLDPETVDRIVEDGIDDGSIILIKEAQDDVSAIISLKE